MAITIAMDKIERRHPETYRQHPKWISLNKKREEYCCEFAKAQVEYHKDRYKRTQDEESAKKVRQYEQYLKKFDKKPKE